MSLWKRISLVVAIVVAVLSLARLGSAQDAKGDAKKGKEVFEANCGICHNADSDEDKVGPGLKGISKKPAHKMSDGTEHKDHSAAVLRKQIMEGSSMMPPVGASLSAEEVSNLIAYLQSL